MPYATLLDIAKANGSDAVAGLIEESTKAHPELMSVPARTIKGTNYKTLVRTAVGQTTGGFRVGNSGVTPVKSTFENRQFETYILETHWMADKAIADAYEDGAAAYIAMEAAGLMEGEMQGLATQFYYGTGAGGNALGFPGLLSAYDATNMVVDAGGTTASTGSSVWAVKFGAQHVQWVWGENGKLELTPAPADILKYPTLITDANDSTKRFMGYFQGLSARPGLQVASVRSIGRIKKLTADTGKGLTDTLIAQLLSKFEVGVVPDALFMNRRSAMQLQTSRPTVIQAGPGAARPAGNVETISPSPDAAFGIPILVTDAISSTESLTL